MDELVETIASRLALDVRRVTLEFDANSDRGREQIARLYRHAHVIHETPNLMLRSARRARLEARTASLQRSFGRTGQSPDSLLRRCDGKVGHEESSECV